MASAAQLRLPSTPPGTTAKPVTWPDLVSENRYRRCPGVPGAAAATKNIPPRAAARKSYTLTLAALETGTVAVTFPVAVERTTGAAALQTLDHVVTGYRGLAASRAAGRPRPGEPGPGRERQADDEHDAQGRGDRGEPGGPPPGGRGDERAEGLLRDGAGRGGQRVGQPVLGPGHAGSPSWRARAAIPRAAVDLTVPALMPSTAAISASGSPSQ